MRATELGLQLSAVGLTVACVWFAISNGVTRPVSAANRSVSRRTIETRQISLLFVGSGAIALLPVSWALAVVVGGAGLLANELTKRGHRDRALVEKRRALPATLDVAAVVLAAGGTVNQVLRVVSTRGPVAVRPSFLKASVRANSGALAGESVALLTKSLGNEYQPLVRALVLTEEGGAPVGWLLDRLSNEARASRRRMLEAQARRIPVALLFPLVLCSLPAVVVAAVVPLALVMLGQVSF